MLGPGMNVARVPRNGRNFEYMSGEDPCLGATLVPSVITASQSHKILANAKHFVNNNQETNRNEMSSQVDERTRFEMYYPPFQAAIDAGVGSFMCSYNKINHVYSCENPETLVDDLKGAMGFEGFVMSDWGATHSASLLEGLDQEMADSDFMNFDNLSGMPIDKIDASVRRILKPFVDVGAFDLTNEETNDNTIYNNVTTPEHFEAARSVARESHVLVQNDNDALPLTADFWASDVTIAVFGSQANDNVIGGGGSGRVDPAWKPTPLGAIHATAAGGEYGAKSSKVHYMSDHTDVATQVALADSADVCLFFFSTSSGEGSDRGNLNLDNDWHASEVANHCTRSVAVVTTPGAVLMPWSGDVDAIIVNFMPGVASAFATMDILLGDYNPSGRLPITMPATENQEGLTQEQFPGLDGDMNSTYTERYDFGYRWYHSHLAQPRFWFGSGLSYSSFEIGEAKWSSEGVKVKISNVGGRDGNVVPQLYLNAPEECDLPIWALKGFDNVFVEAGKDVEVKFEVGDKDVSVWDVDARAWKVCGGVWGARVAWSAEEQGEERLEKTF